MSFSCCVPSRPGGSSGGSPLGGWEKLVNPKAKDKQTLALLDALVDWQKEDKLFENQQLFLTPIVRNGRQATVGYQPDVWKSWE